MPLVRLSQSTYDRLNRHSKRSGIPMAHLVAEYVKKLEVKPLKGESEGMMICCDCEVEIPNICKFCPECGIEFELDESGMPVIDESEDEEEEDEEEDEEDED